MSDQRLKTLFTTITSELGNVQKSLLQRDFAISRQCERLSKKALFKKRDGLEEAAIHLFLSANDSVADSFPLLPDQVVSEARIFILKALENFTSRNGSLCIQESLDLNLLFSFWKFGPGASFGTKSTHAVEKMYDRWSCTAAALPLARKLRRAHPYLCFFDRVKGDISLYEVPGSKMATVPKNQERDRTIAIEPLGNMALQLAAGRYLEGALRYVGLNIRNQQPLNKALAKLGSMSDSFSTLDLKMASDMISPALVRLLLPAKWYELLMQIRSPSTIIPGGDVVSLRMISTMGNGFTFPLMTLILVSLIFGMCSVRGLTQGYFLDMRKVAVFGDDIIVPSNIAEDTIRLITAAGLIVNTDKSYVKGPFRESCGGDYYQGYDVTPFYVQSLNTDPEVYVAINQVLDWASRHEIFMSDTLTVLLGMLAGPLYLVPEWEGPASGILTTRVTRRYKKLSAVQEYRRCILPDILSMPLVCGGYLCARGDNSQYLPRLFKTRHKVVKSKLPNGYLDGRWPVRPLPASRFIEDLLLAVL